MEDRLAREAAERKKKEEEEKLRRKIENYIRTAGFRKAFKVSLCVCRCFCGCVRGWSLLTLSM